MGHGCVVGFTFVKLLDSHRAQCYSFQLRKQAQKETEATVDGWQILDSNHARWLFSVPSLSFVEHRSLQVPYSPWAGSERLASEFKMACLLCAKLFEYQGVG